MNAQEIFAASKIVHHKELKDYLGGSRTGIPVTMELDLTNKCSHRCPLCVGRRAAEADGEQLFPVCGNGEVMAGQRAADYIRQMAEAGVKGLIFTGGGEPTLHPDLSALVMLAADMGIDVGLITHGGLLHRLDVESLVTHCAWIRVSVDAANPEEFMESHGRGRDEWNRVWVNVRLLVSARKRIRGKATLGLGYLVGEHNLSSLHECARLGKEAGVDYVQFRPYHRWAGMDISAELANLRTEFNSEDFQVVGSVQKFRHVKDGEIAPRNYDYCHITSFASVICANEKMYVCCHHRNLEAFCIGDLKKQTFREIMESQHRAAVNGSIDVGRCLPLCRGDNVNREVQGLLSNPLVQITQPEPPHVNFL